VPEGRKGVKHGGGQVRRGRSHAGKSAHGEEEIHARLKKICDHALRLTHDRSRSKDPSLFIHLELRPDQTNSKQIFISSSFWRWKIHVRGLRDPSSLRRPPPCLVPCDGSFAPSPRCPTRPAAEAAPSLPTVGPAATHRPFSIPRRRSSVSPPRQPANTNLNIACRRRPQ
jgi:hypothetical protein